MKLKYNECGVQKPVDDCESYNKSYIIFISHIIWLIPHEYEHIFSLTYLLSSFRLCILSNLKFWPFLIGCYVIFKFIHFENSMVKVIIVMFLTIVLYNYPQVFACLTHTFLLFWLFLFAWYFVMWVCMCFCVNVISKSLALFEALLY